MRSEQSMRRSVDLTPDPVPPQKGESPEKVGVQCFCPEPRTLLDATCIGDSCRQLYCGVCGAKVEAQWDEIELRGPSHWWEPGTITSVTRTWRNGELVSDERTEA